MALARKYQKIFGKNAQATDLSVVGSKSEDNPQYSVDVETLQSLSNWESGMRSIVTPSSAPYLEDHNSLFYVITSQLAYLFQAGIAEWNSQTEYVANRSVVLRNGKIYVAVANSTNVEPEVSAGWGGYWINYSFSLLQENFFDNTFVSAGGSYPQGAILSYADGGGSIYKIKSLVANNANAPTSSNIRISSSQAGTFYWELVNNGFMPSMVMPFSGDIVPNGWLLCDGSAISRTTYGLLFAIIGTKYGDGDGSTTFNLPDYRNKTFWGGDTTNAGTEKSAGLPNIKGTISSLKGSSSVSVTGALSFSRTHGCDSSGGGDDEGKVSFNAHNSNPIYDDSVSTVQPPAIQTPFIIKC